LPITGEVVAYALGAEAYAWLIHDDRFLSGDALSAETSTLALALA
jgi:hypothetical protein